MTTGTLTNNNILSKKKVGRGRPHSSVIQLDRFKSEEKSTMPGTDHIGQIESVSMKWKLSFAVSSNEVKNLSTPMVTLILSTTEESGSTHSRSIEMTVAEFEDLHSKMQEIKVQMDNAKLL